MRVLLIAPPHSLEEHPTPPLSLGYLSAALQSRDIEVDILDLLTSKPSAAKIRRRLEQCRPQLVGVTCVTMNFASAARILRVSKEADPEITTVIGGPHVTFAVDDTLRRCPWIDVVVLGEADATIVELASALASHEDIGQIPGIAFAHNGTTITTRDRPFIEELDGLPLPARELLPLSRYKALDASCSVISTRGCPYGCVFCSAPKLFGRRVRFRTPELVVDEIESISQDLGFRRVNIVDDTFTLNHKHTHALCQEIIRRNLSVEWNAYSRVDTLDRHTLEHMKEAGCTFIVFGIESGSQQILDRVGKGITVEKARQCVKMVSEVGMGSFASFILGLPGETPQTARQSLELAREFFDHYGVQYGFHFLSPLPGTAIYERPGDFGLRVLTRHWARYNANEPITEAGPGSLLAVREIAREYDETIQEGWEKIRVLADAGDKPSTEALRNHEARLFVWELLRNDTIEALGNIKGVASPREAEEKLIDRVCKKMEAPAHVVVQELSRLSGMGLLRPRLSGDRCQWQWA